MNYLLDTNVISETMKKTPNISVVDFIKSIPQHNQYINVLTIGEIRKGIGLLNNIKKIQEITHWLENDLLNRFYGRIINIDIEIAEKWGRILSIHNNVHATDSLIAASAIVHNHKLVTRNVKDFKMIQELEIINPWDL